MTIKKRMIDDIIDVEGGYVNDPHDSGGETNYGITKSVARRYGYYGAMRSLPRDLAFRIYEDKYWDKLNLDLIETRAASIAYEMLDTGVNMGTRRAGEFLQRALNALNNRGALYPDLYVDGDIGPKSVRALYAYIDKRGVVGEKVLHNVLNCLQGEFYISLAERRQKDERFMFGWFKNRIVIK